MMRTAIAYPHTITRRRTAPGLYDAAGVFTPGSTVETALPANVQPMALTDEDVPGGARLTNRVKVYVPDSSDTRRTSFSRGFSRGFFRSTGTLPGLSAAFDDRRADRVAFGGDEYVVEESQIWAGSHVRAILLRQT